ncbi:D-inositol-3-phosphate glycosyltransferase [Candidatus Tiddalikarchaeum anstoanum]|nr:D-inositol-3-phosphate glycosyltransferase [Candidatus Tiddalikarchaeum anstoanum]
MKILHFTWDTPIPGLGGSTHELSIARAFQKLGNEIRIVCEWNNEESVKDVLDGIEVRRVYWRISSKNWLNMLVLFLKSVTNSVYQINNFSPDIVYERYRIFGGVGAVIGKLLGKKTILEVNDPTVDAPYIEKRISFTMMILASIWEYCVFKFADKIITHDKIMTKRASPKKVRVLTNGVDTELFNPEKLKRDNLNDKFVCLFVGTFAKWQGVETILKAAEKLKKYKKILFVFAGGTGENSENTRFLGRVNYNKIPQIIADSDVCLYVPDTENYEPMKRLGFYFSPLKLFEYMSMAKPVIVTDAGNLQKLVKNGINGFRVKTNDDEDLVKCVLKLYKSKRLTKKIGETNRDICLEKYDWVSIAERILK